MRGLIKSLCFLLVIPTLVLAQGFPPLIVEEIDGSPTGVTTKIKVSNTTLSRSGTVATITIGGGSQTPWTSDINGSTFNLTTTGTINATQLQVAGVNVSTSTYTNATAYNATGWTKSGNWVNTTVAGDNVSISGLLNITPATDLIPLTLKGLLGGSADLLEAYNGTILRTELFSGGSQNWYFGATGAESAIKYSTPGGYPGITLNYNAATALASLGSKSGQANWGRSGEYGFKHYTGGYMELGQSSDSTASRAQLDIYNSVGTTKVGLSVQGAASQTGNLQDWRNSTGTVLVCVNATGNVGIGTATPATTLDVNGVINATGGNSTYWNAKPGNSAIHFTITNGTSALSTGWAGQVMAINNFTITSVKTISTDFTKGNITIRVGKFIPNAGIQNYTAANFTTCGNLTLASAQYNNDTTLTGWNTTVTAGELFGLNVTAADTVKSVYVIIR